MLHLIYKHFKTHLKNSFPDITVDDYKGEFNEKSPTEWNPRFPCCLIMLEDYAPVIRAASNQIIKHSVNFTLFFADKNDNNFKDVQEIIDTFNGVNLLIGGELVGIYCNIQVNSVKFVTAIKSVRVHSIEISIQL